MKFSALVLTVIVASIGPPTYANLFKVQDVQGLDAMIRPLLNAQQDNVNIFKSLAQARSYDFADCINGINGELSSLHATLSSLSTLLHISAVMDSPFDEKVVNDSIAIDVKSALVAVSISRRYVSQNSATCGASAIVVSRAQVALRFFDDAERILLWLRSRF